VFTGQVVVLRGENEMGAGTCLKADVLASGSMPTEAVRG